MLVCLLLVIDSARFFLHCSNCVERLLLYFFAQEAYVAATMGLKGTWEWIEGPFTICHAGRTAGQDKKHRHYFNKNYKKVLWREGIRSLEKCLQCDCRIKRSTEVCGHQRCEKRPKCGTDTSCTKVAAHVTSPHTSFMLLARTCLSCNSSGGCFSRNHNGFTLVFKLKRKKDDY